MSIDMPEDEKTRDGQIAAVKTPSVDVKTGAKTKAAAREARLADALRQNLRRRKAGPKDEGTNEKAPIEAPDKETKDE